eukprot:TRINITY_DN1198_c0_g1_i1.p1 TRINITY_DN1198_c0_g1~~TRINITY_DN1198_c0_g1_i1.p1  ORF type:complete len:229 (-),score=23.45 TRINITY_DN1198_c0_g1_i1:28-714(-)
MNKKDVVLLYKTMLSKGITQTLRTRQNKKKGTVPSCMAASQLVDWLQIRGIAGDIATAVEICQDLVTNDLIRVIPSDAHFPENATNIKVDRDSSHKFKNKKNTLYFLLDLAKQVQRSGEWTVLMVSDSESSKFTTSPEIMRLSPVNALKSIATTRVPELANKIKTKVKRKIDDDAEDLTKNSSEYWKSKHKITMQYDGGIPLIVLVIAYVVFLFILWCIVVFSYFYWR